MLAAGTDIFVLIPNAANTRVLHPGKVLEVDAQHVVAEFDDSITPAAGSEVIVYGNYLGKFYQQGAAVIELRTAGLKPIIGFSRIGDAVSAEQRQIYRVTVALSGIVANLGKERSCQVVDMSPEGFGAISAKEHKLGSTIEIAMVCEGQDITAMARIQTCKKRYDGKFRYGMLIPDRKNPARKSLELASASIQRQQLRRLSGAA